LIVNGFDRTSGTVNSRDFVRQHGVAILQGIGFTFDSCNNEALVDGHTLLNGYLMVDWISGEEGTANSSFDAVEQSLVRSYLQDKGWLFVSGSEIGYDLVDQGSAADQDFYREILHAEYVTDDVGAHQASGVAGTEFATASQIAFDDGTHGGYDVDYPDGIRPAADATLLMTYDGINVPEQGGAAVGWRDPNQQRGEGSAVVYLAFPFEMIYDAGQRLEVMRHVVDHFGLIRTAVKQPPATTPARIELLPNYPNPFNPQTTMSYSLSQSGQVRAILYNALGQQVRLLLDEWQAAGEHRRVVTLTGLPSGVYFVRLRSRNEVRVQKWLLQK